MIYIDGPGRRLSAKVHTPDLPGNEKSPAVIISHGFMSNKEDYLVTELSRKLRSYGFTVVTFDFNGHGHSDGRFQDMTVLSEVEDLKAVISYTKSLPGTGCINLAGHSQGGVVTALTAGELGDMINSIALLAPAAVLVDDSRRGNIMGSTFSPADPPSFITVYGFKVGREYILEAQNLKIYETASAYKGRACIIHGSRDTLVPPSYGEKFQQIFKGSEFHLLHGENHGFTQNTGNTTDIAAAFFKSTAGAL